MWYEDNIFICILLDLFWFGWLILFYVVILMVWYCFIFIVVEDYLEEDGIVLMMKCFNFFKNSL